MISVAELRTALRIEPLEDAYAEEAEVAYLEDLEAAAVAFVERHTGRYFGEPVERTEYVAGIGQREFWLAENPVATGDPPEVVIAVAGDGEAIEAADYELRGRKLRHTSAWGASGYPADLVVTYTAGYEPGEEPPDIRQAVTMLVSHWYEHRTPVMVDAGVVEVPMTVRNLLAPFRRVLL